MRILKLIFSATIFFIIITAIGFFSAREALLYWGTSKIKSSFRTLYQSKNRGSFRSQCQKLGSTAAGGEKIVTYQLRFLSSREYVLEAVCSNFTYDPILIDRVTLPQFVTKVPGASGFILDAQQGGIEIQVFVDEINRLEESLGIDLDKLLKTNVLISDGGSTISDITTGVVGGGPITSCGGYGYECCQDVSQVGVGSRITGLVDCEKTCYSSCATRPIILSFNTNPIFDPRERLLTISNNETVEFTYVADAGKATTVGGVLDFGDGKKLPVTGLAGQSSHTFSCEYGACEYYVQLILEDNWGIESADTNVSKIKVVVGN